MMMRPQSTRRIAVVLAVIAAMTAILGFDAVFEDRVTDRFLKDKTQPICCVDDF